MTARTISRSLKRNGLHSFYPRKTLLLTPMHLKVKLKYAKDHHVDKEKKLWNSLIWINETKMELFGMNQAQRVWRNTGHG